MPHDLTRVAAWLLVLDPVILTMTLWGAVLGTLGSTYAIALTLEARNLLPVSARHDLRRSVLRLHLVTQSVILACQGLLLVVSFLMATVPVPPAAMWLSSQGEWVIVVIAFRKIARLLTSVLLCGLSAYKVSWLHRWID